MLPKFVKLLWGTVSLVSYSSRMIQGISVRQKTFEDSDRCGRPGTVATEQNVAKVKYLIKEDPQMTENEIEDSLNLSSGS